MYSKIFLRLTRLWPILVAMILTLMSCNNSHTTDRQKDIVDSSEDTIVDNGINIISTIDVPENTISINDETNSDIIFNDKHWNGCPLFVDFDNAIHWYTSYQSLGANNFLNSNQKAILELSNFQVEQIDDNGVPYYWYPFPAIVGSNRYILCREGHYIVFHGENDYTMKQHVHFGTNRVDANTEILFSEDSSFTYDGNILAKYSWSQKIWEHKLPEDTVFISNNINLGLIFFNGTEKKMYCIRSGPKWNEYTTQEVKDVSCILTANYTAGSVYEYPLILTKEGEVLIYFGDRYNAPMAKLYDDTDLPIDTDFGDNVMKSPKYSENNIPWAGDTGL